MIDPQICQKLYSKKSGTRTLSLNNPILPPSFTLTCTSCMKYLATGIRWPAPTPDLKVRTPTKILPRWITQFRQLRSMSRLPDAMAATQIKQMETNAAEFGITLHGMYSPHRGIVHVISPELGRTQPGMTIVCGDSHTATHERIWRVGFRDRHIGSGTCACHAVPIAKQATNV